MTAQRAAQIAALTPAHAALLEVAARQRAALLEAAAWNRADLRGIDDITPNAPMLRARSRVLRQALKVGP